MHPHAVAGTMESIRTPSPPADARVPRETPRGARKNVGLQPHGPRDGGGDAMARFGAGCGKLLEP